MTIGKRLSLGLFGLLALALQGCGGGDDKSGADPKIPRVARPMRLMTF